MSIKNKVVLAIALVVGSSSFALAQGPAGKYSRQYPARQPQHAKPLWTAPVAMPAPGISMVQPDNYQYWRQACCL